MTPCNIIKRRGVLLVVADYLTIDVIEFVVYSSGVRGEFM